MTASAREKRKEKKDETTPVYRLRTTSQLGIPKFWKFFSRNFSFHSILPWYFYNFRLNGCYFGNSTISGISGNFSGKFLSHLPLFPNFRKFWFNGNGPSYCKFSKMLFHSLLEVAENSNRTFWLNGKRPCFSGRNIRNGN